MFFNKKIVYFMAMMVGLAACGQTEHGSQSQQVASTGVGYQIKDFAPDAVRGQKLAQQYCASCHGADGNSAISTYPKLAGMNLAYLIKYTTRIQKGERVSGQSAVMKPMVQDLNAQDIIDVSAYFARQVPKLGEADPRANLALGKQIYHAGLPEFGIPACMSCHSPNGAGTPAGATGKDGTAGSPRLAGQHAAYLITQLEAYQAKTRPSDKMQDITKRMNKEQIQAVANYLQGLH